MKERKSMLSPLSLRLPTAMVERIRAAAHANRRSMNSEVIIRLEKALGANEEATGAEFGDRTPVTLET